MLNTYDYVGNILFISIIATSIQIHSIYMMDYCAILFRTVRYFGRELKTTKTTEILD